MIKFLLTGLLGVFAVSALAQLPTVPVSITLSWDVPNSREDGSPLDISELAGYELSSSCDATPYVIPDPQTTAQTISVQLPFDCTYTIKSVDTDGLRSVDSLPLTVRFNAPLPPVLNAVQVN